MRLRNRIPLGFWCALLGLLTYSCNTANKVAGGSPGETTNGITALAVDAAGKPALAKVYLYNLETVAKIDSLQTDSTGSFHFSNLGLQSYGIEIINGDSSQMNWTPNPSLAPDTTTKKESFALHSTGALTVTSDSTGDTVSLLQLVGSPYHARRANNIFTLHKIPQQTYLLADNNGHFGGIVKVSTSTQATAHFWASGVPIENFDAGTQHPLFAPFWPGSFWLWWLGADSTTSAVSPTSSANFTKALVDSGAWSGKSLRIQYKMDTSQGRSYQWIGFRLGAKLNLTNLDSVSMMVKGNGLVQVGLEHLLDTAADPTGLYPSTNPYQKAVWQDSATTTWRRVVFRMSDSTVSPTNTTWNSIADRVDQLSVFFLNETDVWIDDITFYGISPLQLMVTPARTAP